MRNVALAFAVGLIAGCAVSTQRYYLPSDPQYAQTGTVCGFVPWGQAQVALADGLTTAIQLQPLEGRVALSMQIALPQGASVRLMEPKFRLQVPSTGAEYSARLDRFQVAVFGRDGRPGYYEYVSATDVLVGKGRNADLAGLDTQYAKKDLFISSAVFTTVPAPSYMLKLPPIEVNGFLREAQSVPVALVEKMGVAVCVQ